MMAKERLQKVLSAQNILSRRKAEEAISEGRIMVNGKVAVLGQKVDPEIDHIVVDPEILKTKYTTIAFHKPRGIVTNCPQGDERSISDLLPQHLRHLSSIGRLDKDSEG
ncbi:MAG: rRNA pseudouridine synthase, partial [Candidatus Margulisbacteria bacterium]|nr:rRNA pseudouridine synthase [Candidatus Margulisiibacteriota bacterium]